MPHHAPAGASERPLHGIRVIDFTQLIAGPSAADSLGRMGADVIKVEPLTGDAMRFARSPHIPTDAPAPSFMTYNHHKRSVALDVKTPEGLAIAEQLIATADVVMQSFRPGVADRLGIGYERASSLRPGVVYASISAFGDTAGSRAGVDIAVQAEAGLMSVTGTPESGPTKVGVPIVDAATGYAVDRGILAALLARSRTGRGSHVEISMLDVALHLQAQPLAEFYYSGHQPALHGNSAPYASPADSYQTADGQIVVSAYLTKHWPIFCSLIGRERLAHDPRFATLADRVSNRDALRIEVESALTQQPTATWLDLFLSRGLAVGAIRSYQDLTPERSPLAAAALTQATGPDGRPFTTVRSPERLPGVLAHQEQGRVPDLGEHTSQILTELGYSPTQIDHLITASVIGTPAPHPGEVSHARQ